MRLENRSIERVRQRSRAGIIGGLNHQANIRRIAEKYLSARPLGCRQIGQELLDRRQSVLLRLGDLGAELFVGFNRNSNGSITCQRQRRRERLARSLITAANQRLSRVESIKRFRIVAEQWSPAGGQLTPTLKLRRREIENQYADEIEELYA